LGYYKIGPSPRTRCKTFQSSRLNLPPGAGSASTFLLNASEGWTLCSSTDFGAPQPPGGCAGQVFCGSSWLLYHTVDSGSRWQLIARGIDFTPPQIFAGGLFFTDSKHGFLGTSNADRVGRLLLTSDGGHTWASVQLPPPPDGWPGIGSTRICGIYSPCVLTPAMFGRQGVTVVETAAGRWFTYTTADGGMTWTNPRSMPVAQPQSVLGAVDAREWWVVSATGELYRTADAGANWVRIETRLPSGYSLTTVRPAGGDVLWGTTGTSGLGLPAYLLRSIDGGKSWVAVNLPGTKAAGQVARPDAQDRAGRVDSR
jgi:hypothetical protein